MIHGGDRDSQIGKKWDGRNGTEEMGGKKWEGRNGREGHVETKGGEVGGFFE